MLMIVMIPYTIVMLPYQITGKIAMIVNLWDFMISAKIIRETVIIAIVQADVEGLLIASVILDTRHQKKFL